MSTKLSHWVLHSTKVETKRARECYNNGEHDTKSARRGKGITLFTESWQRFKTKNKRPNFDEYIIIPKTWANREVKLYLLAAQQTKFWRSLSKPSIPIRVLSDTLAQWQAHWWVGPDTNAKAHILLDWLGKTQNFLQNSDKPTFK